MYPYPGFSWSITQHVAPAANSNVIYELLTAAYMYSDSKSYRREITEYMIHKGLLTPNIRQDQQKPELWRDYQQILPELGLIVSTRFTKGVTITPIGLMWLDGVIGYSELITTQILKYQYPNGHKQDISPTIKLELSKHSSKIPNNRVVLDTSAGVLIKPAVLILRILLTLFKETGSNNGLTPNEITLALMPIKRNEDWPQALLNLKRIKNTQKADVRRLRHVQEWLRLLSLSDIFELEGTKDQKIRLKRSALSNIKFLETLCVYHEKSDTFWFPQSENPIELGLDWFQYFGSIEVENQWLVEENLKSTEYIQENYPQGVFDEQVETLNESITPKELNLLLKEYFPKDKHETSFDESENINMQNIIEGRKKIFEKTKLHNEIVKLLANSLINKGFHVFEDKKSVDLLARDDYNEFIFEVKTINKNNIFKYFRLGVGQLLEYRFRRHQQSKKRPRGILVLSSTYNFPNWAIDFMNTDIDLGLLGLDKTNNFKPYTNGIIEDIVRDY